MKFFGFLGMGLSRSGLCGSLRGWTGGAAAGRWGCEVSAVVEQPSDEAVLVQARRRLGELATLLEVAPFSAETEEAMRTYLLEEASTAREAFARWSELPAQTLRTRVAVLREALS